MPDEYRGDAEGSVPRVPQPDQTSLRPFDPAEAQERARSYIAYALVAVFAGTIAASFALLWHDPSDWGELKDLFEIALAAETGVLGAVIGFYFASRS